MKKIGLLLLAGFLALLCSHQLVAQSDDPSEVFLKAYLTSQQGEKLEHESQFKSALAKYRFAGSLLEELRKRHADWQPAIVDYRSRKVSEGILRVQGKASTQDNLASGTAPLPNNAPVVPPQNPRSNEPSVEIGDAAIKETTKKLQDKVDQLQTDLQKSRTEFDAVQKEKESLNGRLQETSAKLEKAKGESDKSKGAEKQVRDQLAEAQDSLKKIQSKGGGNKQAEEALRDEIAKLKKAVAGAESGRVAAEKAKDEASKQAAGASKERDTAIAQLKGTKDAQQRVQILIAENTDLKQKLADAEKTVREINAEKPKKEQELAGVKQQIDQLRQQLAASQKQNKEYEVAMTDLRSQLDQAAGELEKVKLTGANPEETTRLVKENAMLRNIVVRERQEEARRDQAKKLMLAEFDKLQIKSETLNEQIQLLAQPIAKLTTEELALLRQPVVSISDDNPSALKASFTFAKKSPGTPGKPGDPNEKPSTPEPQVPSTFQPEVPNDLVGLAWQAKGNFDGGKYRTAEKQYQELLTKSPNNLYAISNLGVVYFRTGKLKAAELMLKKAVAISPKDEFSHTTLGIVYYRQSKFDEALTELTKALAINPKSATAHNYLGITASQKGWQEAAQKEMLEAIENNPAYADAHFNLAVIYATAQPPAKELGKRYYVKARELGVEPDATLEKLLR